MNEQTERLDAVSPEVRSSGWPRQDESVAFRAWAPDGAVPKGGDEA